MEIEAQPFDDGWYLVRIIDDMGILEAVVNDDGDYMEGVTFNPSPLVWEAIKKAITKESDSNGE